MQQALHTRRQSIVVCRIPPTPFVVRESVSATVFSKMTRCDETLVLEDSYHSDVVVSQVVDKFTFQRVCPNSPVNTTTTSRPLPRLRLRCDFTTGIEIRGHPLQQLSFTQINFQQVNFWNSLTICHDTLAWQASIIRIPFSWQLILMSHRHGKQCDLRR